MYVVILSELVDSQRLASCWQILDDLVFRVAATWPRALVWHPEKASVFGGRWYVNAVVHHYTLQLISNSLISQPHGSSHASTSIGLRQQQSKNGTLPTGA